MDYSKTHYYKANNNSTVNRTKSTIPDFERDDTPMYGTGMRSNTRTTSDTSTNSRTNSSVLDQPVSPGFGEFGNVTPSLPQEDQPVSPGFGEFGNVTPSLPQIDQPVSPGFGEFGNVTPSLPSDTTTPPSSSGSSNVLWSWAFLSPLFANIPSIAQARFYNSTCIMEPIDIYLNGQLVVSELDHAEYTDYLYIIPGYYTMTVYRTTNPGVPIISSRVNFVRNSTCIVSVLGTFDNFSLQFIC